MVIRGWMLKANLRIVGRIATWLIVLVAVFIFGLAVGRRIYWTEGFREAYFAQKCGCLECEVAKRFPEWLNNGK